VTATAPGEDRLDESLSESKFVWNVEILGGWSATRKLSQNDSVLTELNIDQPKDWNSPAIRLFKSSPKAFQSDSLNSNRSAPGMKDWVSHDS
jgi:hypothetical protein